MASLLTIPLELLVVVSSFLSTPDLGALRLTCKQVEKSLYEWFSKEFFTKKQFMLTHKSLQALFDISRHAGFAQKLSHVIIATNVYVNRPLMFKDKDAAARYIKGYHDQITLLNTGVDREMLTESFKNLKNLQTVGIRDFNNHERSRDGTNWTSWGAPTVHQETGIELEFTIASAYASQSAEEFLPRVFQNLIYALGKSGRHPQELEILLRHHSLPESAFNIPDFMYPAVEGLLFGLQKLLLRTNASHTIPSHMHGGLHPSFAYMPGNLGCFLRRFLACTPNLAHLRLNLPKYDREGTESFLQWLSTAPAPLGSQLTDHFFEPPQISLAHLTALDLGQFEARPPIILDLIARFAPTLEHLELWKISLIDSSTVPGGYSVKSNLWSRFFSSLSRIPGLKLTHMKVGMLSQDRTFVQFKVSEKDDVPMLKVVEYTGTRMHMILEELTEQVTVLWPNQGTVLNAGDSEDDEDEDEDEDMDDDDDDSDEYGDDA